MGSRGAFANDPATLTQAPLEENLYTLEVLADGANPQNMLQLLATQGAQLSSMQNASERFLQCNQVLLTLEQLDIGYHGLVESGPFVEDTGAYAFADTRAWNVLGRLATLGVHLVDVVRPQSLLCVSGSTGAHQFWDAHSCHGASSTLVGFAHLESVDVQSPDPTLGSFNYHTYTLRNPVSTVVANPFGSPLKIRFSVSDAVPQDVTNPATALYDETLSVPTPAFTQSTQRPSLLYLDESRVWNSTSAWPVSTDGVSGAETIGRDATQANLTPTDPSLAWALQHLRIPIRMLFSLKPLARTYNAYVPFPRTPTGPPKSMHLLK